MSRRPLPMTPDRNRLERAVEAAGFGEFELDVARDRIFVSRRLSEITGLPAGEMEAEGGLAVERWAHPDDRASLRAWRDVAAGDSHQAEFRHVRPDDQRVVWLRVAGLISRDADGTALCFTGIVSDISALHDEEARRQQAMAELDHRVKNVLAAVQVLATQTAKRTTSRDAFLQDFSGRLKAMASANELLTAARWRGAAIDHLVTAELGALAPGQTKAQGPELFLTPRAANALSLALHELGANAVKYGALTADTGRVEVRWNQASDGGFELTWTESGGPRVGPPSRRGFGSTLLEQVTGRELNGEAKVEYLPSGVRVRLRAAPQALAPRPETVPEAPAPRPPEPAAAAGPANLKGSRVLIVEDAVLLALELETGLSEAGAIIVGPAYELEEAMALLDQPIDAAVLDANLNGRSVIPVAEVLARRGIPFVFATGYGEAGGPGGFDAPVIRKPYDVTQVAAALMELLAH